MRYHASEKAEIIVLVEGSHRPAKATFQKLGIPRATFCRWYDRYLTSGMEASVYPLLKAHDLITSPDYVAIKAAEFKHKTTAPNQLWQTDFTYLKITGWGRYCRSTELDDYRYIVAWKLDSSINVALA